MEGFKSPIASKGPQEARILRIIDVGIQPPFPNSKFTSEPKRKINVIFELAEDKIEFGGEQKPMVIGLDITVPDGNLGKRSSLFKLIKAIGLSTSEFLFAEMLGKPIQLTIDHNEKNGSTYSKIIDFGPVTSKAAGQIPDLVAHSFFFNFDKPDPNQLPFLGKFQKSNLKRAINFPGSQLEKLLEIEENSEKVEEV